MVEERLPLSDLYSDDELIGRWVKINSKSSSHNGMFARMLNNPPKMVHRST